MSLLEYRILLSLERLKGELYYIINSIFYNMKKPFSIRARLMSFKYAGRGIVQLLKNEHNAWIHCFAMVVVTIAGFYFGITRYEWMFVVLCFGLVLGAEAVNTAIERIVNLVCPERKSQAGDIKDLAAAAVLFCAIAAAVVGLIIFLPYIIQT